MRKIKFYKPGGIYIINDDSHYLEPYRAQYYVEAVTVLDAMIDSALILLATQKYGSKGKRGLRTRDKKGKEYPGLRFAKKLDKWKMIDPSALGAIMDFKGKRNLMVHNREGEFALILKKHSGTPVSSHQQLVKEMKKSVGDTISQGDAILSHLRYQFESTVRKNQQD